MVDEEKQQESSVVLYPSLSRAELTHALASLVTHLLCRPSLLAVCCFSIWSSQGGCGEAQGTEQTQLPGREGGGGGASSRQRH